MQIESAFPQSFPSLSPDKTQGASPAPVLFFSFLLFQCKLPLRAECDLADGKLPVLCPLKHADPERLWHIGTLPDARCVFIFAVSLYRFFLQGVKCFYVCRAAYPNCSAGKLHHSFILKVSEHSGDHFSGFSQVAPDASIRHLQFIGTFQPSFLALMSRICDHTDESERKICLLLLQERLHSLPQMALE